MILQNYYSNPRTKSFSSNQVILDRLFGPQDHDSGISWCRNQCHYGCRLQPYFLNSRCSFQAFVPDYYYHVWIQMNLPKRYRCRKWNLTGLQKCTCKYMIDSLPLLGKKYNIDGFRFDLMGIHDIKPCRQFVGHWMKLISYYHLEKGWDMGTGLATLWQGQEGPMPTSAKYWILQWWSAWCHQGGEVYGSIKAGFVSGAATRTGVAKLIAVAESWVYLSPNQVQLREAHDNYNFMWFVVTRPDHSSNKIEATTGFRAHSDEAFLCKECPL